MHRLAAFETPSVHMDSLLMLRFQSPLEDVERIMAAVRALTPLAIGKYDCNAYQTAGGIERYRPLEGAAAGPETDVRQRPGVVVTRGRLDADHPDPRRHHGGRGRATCHQSTAADRDE